MDIDLKDSDKLNKRLLDDLRGIAKRVGVEIQDGVDDSGWWEFSLRMKAVEYCPGILKAFETEYTAALERYTDVLELDKDVLSDTTPPVDDIIDWFIEFEDDGTYLTFPFYGDECPNDCACTVTAAIMRAFFAMAETCGDVRILDDVRSICDSYIQDVKSLRV